MHRLAGPASAAISLNHWDQLRTLFIAVLEAALLGIPSISGVRAKQAKRAERQTRAENYNACCKIVLS